METNIHSSSTNKNHCISCLTEQDRALTSVRMGAKMTSQKIYYVCLYIKIKYWLIIFCLTCSKDISDQIHYISFDIVLLNLFKNFHCCWNSRNRITWPKNLSIQSICVFPFPGNIFFVYKVVLTRFRSNAVTIFTTVMKWCKIFPNVWFIKRTSYQDILMQKFTLFRVKLHFDRLAGIHVKIYIFVSFIELLLLCIKRVFFLFVKMK